MPFYVNPRNTEWSSFDKSVGWRDGEGHVVEVPTMRFEEILEYYKVPYFLKIDIEMGDIHCLRALKPDDLPQYMSIEAHIFDYFIELRKLGYTAFKLIDQQRHNFGNQITPTQFPAGSSGPFGENAPGEWSSVEAIAYEWLHYFHKREERFELVGPQSWYDIHVKKLGKSKSWSQYMSYAPQGNISEDEFRFQFRQLSSQSGGAHARLPMDAQEIQPILNERTPSFDFDGHYVYHVAWASEILGKLRPNHHVDIGSYHYFSLVVSGFIPTTFLDYRPMMLKGLNGYSSGGADLKNLEMAPNSVPSLSCMHVLEHIGLGRYGDELDYDGDLKAAAELKRVLAFGGDLLIVAPIGRQRIKFNAHRIYSTQHIFNMFDGLELLDFSLIPDDFMQKGIIRHCSPALANSQEYGCGCFWFRKPGIPRSGVSSPTVQSQPVSPPVNERHPFIPDQASYSQCGEDRIMKHLAEWLHIPMPTYLDIGAHDATHLNNTYLFYQSGCRGVLVEPDPSLFEKLVSVRPNDMCLNVGISDHSVDKADFFVMDVQTLNTFSRETAERYCSYTARKIVKVVQVPLMSVNTLIERYFVKAPTILSVDVEGLDFEILTAIDYRRFRPKIICVETLTYTEDNTEVKLNHIIDFLKSVGYIPYADTFINTIFVSQEAWAKR